MADDVPALLPAEAAARLRDGWQAIDVRLDEEVAEGVIEGAVHIELGQLAVRAGEIDRERPLVVICRSGVRSAMAVAALRPAGYDAHNLDGGMLAWAEAGLPVEPAG